MTSDQVTLIVALIALAGSIYNNRASAKKNDVDSLRGIIQELKEYISDLECDKEDLQVWAEKLVCQIKDLGHEPVKFFRSERKTQPRKQS